MTVVAAPVANVPAYTYTAGTFAAAPESIGRVVSRHRVSPETLDVLVQPGVCNGSAAVRPYEIVVRRIERPAFAPGTLLLTGSVLRAGRYVALVRELTPAQAQSYGCGSRVR